VARRPSCPHACAPHACALDHAGGRRYAERVIRAFALAVVLGLVSGCAGMVPPTYTQAELAQQCQRTGGWWHPDDLMGGNCEYETGGFQ
jgi:hypothetical protein